MGILEDEETFNHTVCGFGVKKSTYDCEVSVYYNAYRGPKDFPVTYDFALAREGEVGNNIFGSIEICLERVVSGGGAPHMAYIAYAQVKETDLTKQGSGKIVVFSYDPWSKHVKIDKLTPEWMKLAAGIAFFYAWGPEYYRLKDTKNFNTWMKEWNAAACSGQKYRLAGYAPPSAQVNKHDYRFFFPSNPHQTRVAL